MEIEVTLLLRLLLELFKGWALRNFFFFWVSSGIRTCCFPEGQLSGLGYVHADTKSYPAISESLFTCFASLAKAYHYQMNLIKRSFRILKEHTNFSCVWKFEPDIPNSLGEILFEKPQNLQRMYELINVLPPSNFAAFDCCYFLCYWSQRAETCTSCLN